MMVLIGVITKVVATVVVVVIDADFIVVVVGEREVNARYLPFPFGERGLGRGDGRGGQ